MVVDMQSALRWVGTGMIGVSLVACGGTNDDALASRLAALEKRVVAAEKNADLVERLHADGASLERRLSALETSVRDLATRPAGTGSVVPPAAAMPPPTTTTRPAPSSGPGAWNNPTTRLDRTERRVELRALSDDFRSRLAALREEPGGNDPEKARAILDWYREERRAILRGEGRRDR